MFFVPLQRICFIHVKTFWILINRNFHTAVLLMRSVCVHGHVCLFMTYYKVVMVVFWYC